MTGDSGSEPDLEAQVRELRRQLEEARAELRAADDELAKLTRDLETLSFRDPLTGLYNHRAFHERLHEEVSRANRYEQPLSLIFCDLDEFGAINSRLGYQIGDESLRRLAEEILWPDAKLPSRRSDVAARFEGELFAILLPETGKPGAAIKSERMCELVRAVRIADDLLLSASFGVASLPEDARSADGLIAAARAALAAAKRAGKNRVALCGDDLDDDDEPRTSPPSRPILGSGPPVFPNYHQRMDEIVAVLEREQAIAALYVDLSRLRRVEHEHGLTRHAALFARAGTVLHEMQGNRLRRDDIVCRTEVDDAYVCILSPARHKHSGSPMDLGAIADRVESAIDEALAQELRELGADLPRITVGYARVLNNPLMRPERLVARVIDESRQSAAMLHERNLHRDKSLVQELILHGQLVAVYQPIVHLESGETFGFEALTRGPVDTRLEMPTDLFAVADEVDLTFELDRACFRGGLRSAVGLEPVHRLFVNILPLSFYDSSFIEHEVARLLEQADLTPANLVFEITERLAIENFSAFRRALARYTAMGFGVAIDDVGTRHSNLETVMALRPHFIKLSDILTRGVSTSTVKREMLRSLGRIAGAIDAVIVAEGIEDPDDLAVLGDLGVRYGQGFFLARPGPPFPAVAPAVRDTVRALARSRRSPLPEPATGDDDDEDPGAETSSDPPADIHRAVIERIQQLPGHEEAKTMLRELDDARRRRAGNMGSESASIVKTPEPIEVSEGGAEPEWTPIRDQDLGSAATAPTGPSLLASLRTAPHRGNSDSE